MSSEVRLAASNSSVGGQSVIMQNAWHHLLAGGVGGMTGAVVTSPLEIVKTRLQSSGGQSLNLTVNSLRNVTTGAGEGLVRYSRIWSTLSHIVMEEGVAGLFKGLGPTLLGKTDCCANDKNNFGNEVLEYLFQKCSLHQQKSSSTLMAAFWHSSNQNFSFETPSLTYAQDFLF